MVHIYDGLKGEIMEYLHWTTRIGHGTMIRSTAVIEEMCSIGNKCFIGHYVVMRGGWTIGDNVKIGHGTILEPIGIIGHDVSIQSRCTISDHSVIGDWVFIGPNFTSCADRHMAFGREEIVKYNPKGVTILRGARIGGGVIVLPGITIGKNAVIGAGSLVTKDIPERSVAFGSPAKVIKIIPMEECIPDEDDAASAYQDVFTFNTSDSG